QVSMAALSRLRPWSSPRPVDLQVHSCVPSIGGEAGLRVRGPGPEPPSRRPGTLVARCGAADNWHGNRPEHVMTCRLSPQQIAEFNEQGFTIARKLFDQREVALLTDAMEHDPAVRSHILDRLDGEGRSTRIALWNRAGDSVYGL